MGVKAAVLELYTTHHLFQELLQVQHDRTREVWHVPRHQAALVAGLSWWHHRYSLSMDMFAGTIEDKLDLIGRCSKKLRHLVDLVCQCVKRPCLTFEPMRLEVQMSFAFIHVLFDLALVILHLGSLAPQRAWERFESGFQLERWLDQEVDDICKTHVRDLARLGMTCQRHREFARKIILGHWYPRAIAQSSMGARCRASITRRISAALALHRRPEALIDFVKHFRLDHTDYIKLWL